jgi:hypothetical protein
MKFLFKNKKDAKNNIKKKKKKFLNFFLIKFFLISIEDTKI